MGGGGQRTLVIGAAVGLTPNADAIVQSWTLKKKVWYILRSLKNVVGGCQDLQGAKRRLCVVSGRVDMLLSNPEDQQSEQYCYQVRSTINIMRD